MGLLLGTASGVYVLEGDAAWKRVRRRGPLLGRRAVGALARGGIGMVAAAGDMLHGSRDGIRWAQLARLPAQAQPRRISALATVEDGLVAGTEPAGLWLYEPGSTRWIELSGLRGHPSAVEWWGAAGDPATQAVVVDPRDASHLFAAISIGGIFHGAITAEADAPWAAANAGIPPLYPRESQHREAHRDVRKLVALAADGAGEPLLVAATSHGLYASTHGEDWHPCAGAWAWPGVDALAAAPDGSALYALPRPARTPPEHGGERSPLAVYRSRDRGHSWEPLTLGLAQVAPSLVHRDALAVAPPDGPEAVYLGTSQGELFWSPSAGDEWLPLARGLPSIRAVLPFVPPEKDDTLTRTGIWPFRRA